MVEKSRFDGFPAATVKYLKDLGRNNNREWFADNRATYEEVYVKPAKEFCETMTPRLNKMTRTTHAFKVFRVYRDVRFGPDKTPYHTHMRILFQPARDNPVSPSWFFGFDENSMSVGSGIMDFGNYLEGYRKKVAATSGATLARHITRLENDGFRVDGEPKLKRVPAGYRADHPREELLRRKKLTIWFDAPSPGTVTDADLVNMCIEIYRELKPVNKWLSHIRDSTC